MPPVNTAQSVTFDRIVVGLGQIEWARLDPGSFPGSLVAGLTPGHGLPWQLVGHKGREISVIHLLLAGPDNHISMPGLGRGPKTEPWPATPHRAGGNPDWERELQNGYIARARGSRGLGTSRPIDSQMILASGHTDAGDSCQIALVRDIVAGRLDMYTHVGDEPGWRHELNPGYARLLYNNWGNSLFDAHNGDPGDRPLATTRFGQALTERLNRAMSAKARQRGSAKQEFVPFVKEPGDDWLMPCYQLAGKALRNGAEPMLDVYAKALSHDGIGAWVDLCRLVDGLPGPPLKRWPTTGDGDEPWPYGARIFKKVTELVETMNGEATGAHSVRGRRGPRLDATSRPLAQLPIRRQPPGVTGQRRMPKQSR